MAVNVLGQKRLFGEPLIGVAHFVIFWSFVCYAATFAWNLVRGLFPVLPIPYADETGLVRFFLQVFALAGLAALAVSAARRYLFPPPRLELSGDASLILALIAVVLGTSLAGTLTEDPQTYATLWWAHMLTVLGFLAYLPYSKHLHLLASPLGVFTASLAGDGLPPPSEGAARRDEFTWRQLYNGLACAECGRCDRACPGVASGAALSPKMLMHHLKEVVRNGGDGLLLGAAVKPAEVWGCTTCFSCMERCPVFNEHIPVLIEMRRKLVSAGEVEPRLQEAMMRLTRYGNSFGQSARARAKWSQELSFKVKDARKEPVDCLWITGDYAAFDPRVAPVTRAFARLMAQAGVEFGILNEAEQNSGNDVRRTGEEGLFEVLMEKNVAAIGKAAHRRLITTDPHTYHALRNEYRWSNGHGPVAHYSELLDEWLAAGKLEVRHRLELRATYHDPCYLGRYNGLYDAPRRVLHALGATLVEMPRNRERSFCCGAGGGRIWMEDTGDIKERPAEMRVREAAALGGVSTLVVSCPKDLVMFEDAVKTAGLEGKLEVKDLAQLTASACEGAMG
ncbi:MAG: (Fe-S)-binding protein [Acidobacteria bacterium]|nr:(Fe-S)-binding protein [Acidobacteriota bacterium]